MILKKTIDSLGAFNYFIGDKLINQQQYDQRHQQTGKQAGAGFLEEKVAMPSPTATDLYNIFLL